MDGRGTGADRGLSPPRAGGGSPAEGARSGRRVLLGASNLILGLPEALSLLAGQEDPPGAVHAAVGHGRSFGSTTRVLVRELPSIRDCGLWEAVARTEEAGSGPIRALVTDVGNDLGYGTDPETVLCWVDDVLERLEALGAEITLAGIPEEPLGARTDLELAIARRVFFPRSELTVAGIRAGVERLATGLRELGEARRVRFVEPRSEWYGLDPLHARRSRRPEMLSVLLDLPEKAPESSRSLRPGPWRRFRVWTWAPARRRILGREAGAAQPAGRFRGIPVSLF